MVDFAMGYFLNSVPATNQEQNKQVSFQAIYSLLSLEIV